MTAIERQGTGVRRARQGGREYWIGGIQDVTRALVLASRSGRLTGHGEVRPYTREPGNVVVAVQLVPQPARVTVPPPAPVAVHQSRPRWVWPLVAAVVGLGLVAVVGIVVVQLLGALAAVVPIVLGAAVVAGVAWVILRAGGGGGDAGGGFGGINITQIINVRRR